MNRDGRSSSPSLELGLSQNGNSPNDANFLLPGLLAGDFLLPFLGDVGSGDDGGDHPAISESCLIVRFIGDKDEALLLALSLKPPSTSLDGRLALGTGDNDPPLFLPVEGVDFFFSSPVVVFFFFLFV